MSDHGSCGDEPEVDCSQVLAEIYLFLDLECTTESRVRIQSHLDACTHCLREYGLEREVKALVARCCGNEVAPDHLRQRLRTRLAAIVFDGELRERLSD